MFVKRPIYNQQLKCVAFEILTSQNLRLNAEVSNSLSDLITHSDTQLPLFIPFSLKPLIEQFQPPIQNPIILKLAAEDIESVYPLNVLQDSVFSIALLVNKPQQLAWLNFAEYIGLTEQLMNGADVTRVVKYSKEKLRKVIAYGIGQPINFDKCKTMTMDYYCGDFLFKPFENDKSTEVAANKLNLLELIQNLQKEDCDLNTISTIIQNDPLLSYQLLKVANSVAYSGGCSIASIDQAVARLGLINLKNWVMLFSMKNISNKPAEILESGLIRAYMVQELAKAHPAIGSQAAYTTGLLSILDSLLNKPMTELVGQITLTSEISDALLNQTGPLGKILSLVIAYEAGNWDDIPQQDFHGLDLSKIYIDGLDFVAKGPRVTHD